MKNHFKFLVLGGGSAGYSAAQVASKFTDSIAIVDGSKQLGGLCILHGCMPSKTLIYSAEVLHLAQKGKAFGLHIPNAQSSLEAIQARKRKIINEFAQYRESQLRSEKFHLYQQEAKFIDPHTLELEDGTLLTADKIVIATGSKTFIPDIPGLKDTPYLTSDEILDLDTPPQSIITLGGGIISCELSQYLQRIGIHVTIIQRSKHLLKKLPTDISSVLENAFTQEGIKLVTDTKILSISGDNEEVTVTFSHKDKRINLSAQKLFLALGREPNVSNLSLDKAGVCVDQNGYIKTNKFQQTSADHIYACGDCSNHHEIVHLAVLEGEIAAKHALSPLEPTPIHYQDLVKITFTDPQIATVGKREADLLHSKIPFISASYPFSDHGKSILMEAPHGFVRIVASPDTGKVLGAECVGKDASELIHSMAVGISLSATAQDLLKTHWYHPTLSEIWTYPLEEVALNIKSIDP